MQADNIKPRLKEKYEKEVIPYFTGELGFKNKLMVPSIEKIVLNVSSSKAIEEPKHLDFIVEVLGKITGQKALKTKAKKSVASFKLREGMAIGAKVTLRGKKMYEFLDRLISTALPRVRDFRGTKNKAFDGHGNYSLGITEVTVFPEASNLDTSFSLEVNIKTTAKNNEDAEKLLRAFGLPMKKVQKGE
jgi:large subunit ribosomal protein L5